MAPTHDSRTYQGYTARLVFSTVVGIAGVVAGIVALAVGEIQGLLLLGVGLVAIQIGLRTPHRVTVDDTGVHLQAVARRVHIPWDQLVSVAPPWWDIRHEALTWKRARGLGVMTLQTFPELHRLLTEVEERSPRTFVES